MNRAKVLVVEDDPIVASDIKFKVRDFGYDVCATAATGEQAIEAAKKHRPEVVLMDITLEGKMDGIEAADAVRRELAIPVVFLTAHSDQATVQRAKLTLPYGYVLKPVREVELRIALEMALYSGENKSSEEKPTFRSLPEAGAKRRSEPERAEILSLLKKIEPLAKLPDTYLQQIIDLCEVRTYRALEVIALEGDTAGGDGFVVITGRVSMLKSSPNGREFVVQVLGPMSTFGLLAGLDSSTQELTARAQLESKLLHVPKKALLFLLSERPELYPDFLSELSRRMSALQNMARSLAHDKVDVRIAAALIALCEGKQEIQEVQMSRQELANIAGTTVETAIRITRALEKSGILELPDHRLIRVLDAEKLRDIGEGVDF